VSTGVVAGVLIETLPGAASRVAARLLRNERVEVQGCDGDRRIAAVLTAGSGLDLEALAERILHEDADVLGVHPTFVAEHPPADPPPAGAE
jgi:hypothetical protein